VWEGKDLEAGKRRKGKPLTKPRERRGGVQVTPRDKEGHGNTKLNIRAAWARWIAVFVEEPTCRPQLQPLLLLPLPCALCPHAARVDHMEVVGDGAAVVVDSMSAEFEPVHVVDPAVATQKFILVAMPSTKAALRRTGAPQTPIIEKTRNAYAGFRKCNKERIRNCYDALIHLF